MLSWLEFRHPGAVQCIDENTAKIAGDIYTKADFITGKHPGFLRPHFLGIRRLNYDEPANTIAHEQFFHPETRRLLTVRERARLLDIPDDFIYEGSSASQINQTSKTVPVKPVRTAIRRLIKDGL